MKIKECNFLVAIICICILESVALMLGHNNITLVVAISSISGLGGYSLKDILKSLRVNKNNGEK